MDGLLTRKRADELDAALSGTVPSPRAELADDLAVVARLRETGAALEAAPTDEFRTALRTRLMAVAAVQGIGETAAQPVGPTAVSWRHRAATITAGVTAGVVAVTGVAVASSQALPGDAFYDVKRTAEALQLRLADGPRAEGERHLQFAAERLGEAGELAAGGPLSDEDIRDVLDVLSDMDEDTRAGQRLLTESFRASRDAEPLQRLTEFADGQRRGLTSLLPAVEGAGEQAVRDSLALLRDVATQADELLLLVDCTAACDPTSGAPVIPEPGAPLGSAGPSASCGCATPPPAPSLAPAPPTPAPAPGGSSAPAPTPPAPPPSSTPASPPPSSPPSGPVPGVPLPSLPGVPTLPPPGDLIEDPLAPLEPLTDPLSPVPVPPLSGSGLLDGVVQVAPVLVTGSVAGPAAVAVRWLRSLR